MALLQTKELNKRFGGLQVLVGVDMSIEAGELVGLIGPNGAGKTTLFNLVVGIHKPTSGEVFFKGEPISGLKPNSIASRGLVKTYQANVTFGKLTVEENVLVGCHLQAQAGFLGTLLSSPAARGDKKRLAHDVAEILDFLGLADLRREPAGKLPHGFQRLLGIATALAARPELLLLDEPVTGMNTEEALQTIDLIRKIQTQLGLTVFIIEHDMRVIMNLCQRIYVINFGKKIAEGSPDEIKQDPVVIEAYLGAD